MKGIERLPEAVRGSMRSGVVVCDLPRIVEELVLNSIDAGSTEVSVAVGIGSWYVKVVDNGSGITRDGLKLLGERYATSKVDGSLDTMDFGTESFDFHGEALYSISDVSVLEIVSKARGKPNGYRKIMKNRKCLFLGISDDRVDVGTTVIARDIFYNQPVRRRHRESSSKVLDSIKMVVLRIALIHKSVSFKVMDVESTNELLQTGPSRPPMSILFSNFRIENSGPLYRLNVSNGGLRLSGYISGPCEVLYLKAIQYVYINSRFICKGPVHRLLNQLAAKFDVLYSSKPNYSFQSDKRNRGGQMAPTFILNLNCPRSDYDMISIERSRTSVEFKDWAPIRACIENSITRLWTENISHDTPATFERGRKRFRKQNCQSSVDLGSELQKKLSENYDNVHSLEESASYLGKSSAKVSELTKGQSDTGFLSDTAYQSLSSDISLAYNKLSKNKKSSFHRSPSIVSSPKRCHFEAYSSDKQEDEILFPVLGDFIPEFDDGMNDVSIRSGISVDCLQFGPDIHAKKDLKKSFLKPCSNQGSFFHGKTSPTSDERFEFGRDHRFEFGSDDIRIKKKWVDCDDNILDEIDVVFYRGGKHYNETPPLQAPPVAPYEIDEGSDFLMRDFAKSSVILSDIPPDISEQFFECKPNKQPLDSGWSPVTAEQLVGIKFQETSVESCPDFDEDTTHQYFTQREDGNLVDSNLNMNEGWMQQHSSIMNSVSDHKMRIDECHWGDFENSVSLDPLKRFSETDWSPLLSFSKESSKNYSMSSLHHTPSAEHECGRSNGRMQAKISIKDKSSARSHSAPPIYKGKKICRALFSTEPRNVKYLQKSFGHYDTSPMVKSVIDFSFSKRQGLEKTLEAIEIPNGKSRNKEQMINKETVENEIQDSLDTGQKWRNYCLPATGGNAGGAKKNQDSILDISSGILHLTGDSLVPTSIDKTSLVDAKVLNQVDKKFIAVMAGRTLALIDQHAADERIRLEEFRHKVLSGEMKKITYLDGEQELVLPEISSQLLHNYAEQIQTWGWICNIHSLNTSFFSKNLDSLHRQATVVKLRAVPCILGVNLTDADLLEYLQQLADTDGSSTIPPSVHRLLNNKACRGAIMFGDTLLPSECSLIVEQLTQTSLCFQCAHGRPTTVPVINVDALHNKIAKLGSHQSWHGLQQHKLTIKRSAKRLSSARC